MGAQPRSSDTGRPQPGILWEYGLEWLSEAINVMLPHPLDVDRMYVLAKGMHLVGEEATPAEVRNYLLRRWPGAPRSAREVAAIWREVRAHPHRRFRRLQGSQPLYVVDLLIERHRLEPATEMRLEKVLLDASTAFARVATEPSDEDYRERRRDLERAMDAFRQLRLLRLGAPAATAWGESIPARRPRWW